MMLHGDAAFAGQGVVAETLNLANLPGYRVGGTIHVIVNNQLGFTTAPEYSRSSEYCTDVAKMIGAPIFHVNGDDPEACDWVARLAVDFRQKFKKDVIIDMLCYRRRGHNEGDDPSMTQPYMYDVIDTKRGARKSYTEALIGRGDISLKEAEDALRDFQGQLERVFNEVRELEKHGAQPSESIEADQMIPAGLSTAVDKALLALHRRRLPGALPDGFTVHPRVKPVLEKRREMAYEGKVDWAFAELLALGSLVAEGKLVRFSGQDTRRGTFSQRHSVIIDRNNCEGVHRRCNCWRRTSTAVPTGGKFLVYDSPLSEYATVVVSSVRPTRWATRTHLCCGRGGSATSSTARSRSSTNSSAPVRPSGGSCPTWCCCCRTVTRVRAPTTPPAGSNDSCSCGPRVR